MNKIKYILSTFILSALFVSCDGNPIRFNPYADIDYAELAVKDNDSIVSFLKNHYYDADSDSMKIITSGQTPMYSEKDKLEEISIIDNDITHTLYAYTTKQREPDSNNDFPSIVDSVFVKYEGRVVLNTTTLGGIFDSSSKSWFTLTGVISGWTYGMRKFKGGQLQRDANGDPINGPVSYLNGGKGVLLIPSGLAYPSSNVENISRVPNLVDNILIFYIEMLDVKKNKDRDLDGVPSLMEDLNGDEDPRNDDTDADGIPNFVDVDDDGDGVLTKNEDRNKDGNPANDFNDPSKPDLPDYLNPDIK